MRRFVFLYHGTLPKKFEIALDKVAPVHPEYKERIYEGSLDHFEKAWPGMFCVVESNILVTQHKSWGAR